MKSNENVVLHCEQDCEKWTRIKQEKQKRVDEKYYYLKLMDHIFHLFFLSLNPTNMES